MIAEIVILIGLIGGLVGLLIWSWRDATDSAREYLDHILEAGAVEFSPPVYARLLRHFVWRQRLQMPSMYVIILGAGLVGDWSPTSWRFVVTALVVFAIVIAVSVGIALMTLPHAPRDRTATRVAALRPRTVRRYLHPAEFAVDGVAFLLGITCLMLILVVRPSDDERVDDILTIFAMALVGLMLVLALLQWYLIRLPQNARDQEEQLACDLLVSIALRELLVGGVMPSMVLFMIAWETVFDTGADLSPSAYLLGGVAVALIVAMFLLPRPHRSPRALWRFREVDSGVTA